MNRPRLLWKHTRMTLENNPGVHQRRSHRRGLSARWREVVPGGVTRHLPEHMTIPAPMSH